MLTWLKQIVAPPVFVDEDQTRKAKLLNAMQFVLLVIIVLIAPVILILGPEDALINISFLVPLVGSLLVLLYMLRRGYVELSGLVLVAILWLIFTLNCWVYGGIRNSTHSSYFAIVAIASLLWGGRATLAWGGLCVLSTTGLYVAELNGLLVPLPNYPPVEFPDWFLSAVVFGMVTLLLAIGANMLNQALRRTRQNEEILAQRTTELAESNATLETEMIQRQQAQEESERLQQQIIEAQRETLKELSTPIIPVMEHVIVLPLIGSIDTVRAQDITRALLSGISQHQANVVIIDITGVPIVDSGVANYLNKTIQAARLKGAQVIITGISDAVAETIVELEIDWSGIETLSDLQTGLQAVMTGIERYSN